jgi:hypothetical protein
VRGQPAGLMLGDTEQFPRALVSVGIAAVAVLEVVLEVHECLLTITDGEGSFADVERVSILARKLIVCGLEHRERTGVVALLLRSLSAQKEDLGPLEVIGVRHRIGDTLGRLRLRIWDGFGGSPEVLGGPGRRFDASTRADARKGSEDQTTAPSQDCPAIDRIAVVHRGRL